MVLVRRGEVRQEFSLLIAGGARLKLAVLEVEDVQESFGGL